MNVLIDHLFDSKKTATHMIQSNDDTSNSCYWRTPLFIPKKNASSEDDGYIFLWSHEFEDNDKYIYILILSAIDLDLLVRLKLPDGYNIPYSVHSWIHYLT